ncbi:hypothetical protein KRZ98_21170, partial [Sphingobium sp. AS12]|uniref:hypothetical protein n=1 Tax=Sphingobium sp. AS12 TaxID=2849495 RepID=UPI001C31BA11
PRQTSPATPLKRSNLSNGWFLNRHAQQIAGVPLAWFVTALYTLSSSTILAFRSASKSSINRNMVRAACGSELAISCVFRKFPDTDFGNSRTVISVNTGQRFR